MYPAVKQHLLSFGYDRIKQTGDKGSRKKTTNKWFETQDAIGYWDDFSKQKIIYPGIMRIAKGNTQNFPRFTIDNNKNFFFGNDCYFITGKNLDYLWLLLNSTFCGYLFRYYIYSFDQTGFKIFTDYFQNLPFPLPNQEHFLQAEKFSNNINIDEVDHWVYSLYGFDDNEITEITNSVITLLNSVC